MKEEPNQPLQPTPSLPHECSRPAQRAHLAPARREHQIQIGDPIKRILREPVGQTGRRRKKPDKQGNRAPKQNPAETDQNPKLSRRASTVNPNEAAKPVAPDTIFGAPRYPQAGPRACRSRAIGIN